MTTLSESDNFLHRPGLTQPLPFDPRELTSVRVRPAGLARMLNVSRQAVSQWIKNGHVRLGADGHVDPRVAVKQLLASADPSRIRAKVLQPLTADIGTLQARIKVIEQQNAELLRDKADLADQYDEICTAMDAFVGFIKRDLVKLADSDDPNAEIDALLDRAIHLGIYPDTNLPAAPELDALASEVDTLLGDDSPMRASGE